MDVATTIWKVFSFGEVQVVRDGGAVIKAKSSTTGNTVWCRTTGFSLVSPLLFVPPPSQLASDSTASSNLHCVVWSTSNIILVILATT